MIPRPLYLAILIIFIIHFAIFVRLSLLRRKRHHILAATSFLLLILFSSVRLWVPRLMFFGHPAHIYFRVSAWFSSMMTLTVYIRNRAKQIKQ